MLNIPSQRETSAQQLGDDFGVDHAETLEELVSQLDLVRDEIFEEQFRSRCYVKSRVVERDEDCRRDNLLNLSSQIQLQAVQLQVNPQHVQKILDQLVALHEPTKRDTIQIEETNHVLEHTRARRLINLSSQLRQLSEHALAEKRFSAKSISDASENTETTRRSSTSDEHSNGLNQLDASIDLCDDSDIISIIEDTWHDDDSQLGQTILVGDRSNQSKEDRHFKRDSSSTEVKEDLSSKAFPPNEPETKSKEDERQSKTPREHDESTKNEENLSQGTNESPSGKQGSTKRDSETRSIELEKHDSKIISIEPEEGTAAVTPKSARPVDPIVPEVQPSMKSSLYHQECLRTSSRESQSQRDENSDSMSNNHDPEEADRKEESVHSMADTIIAQLNQAKSTISDNRTVELKVEIPSGPSPGGHETREHDCIMHESSSNSLENKREAQKDEIIDTPLAQAKEPKAPCTQISSEIAPKLPSTFHSSAGTIIYQSKQAASVISNDHVVDLKLGFPSRPSLEANKSRTRAFNTQEIRSIPSEKEQEAQNDELIKTPTTVPEMEAAASHIKLPSKLSLTSRKPGARRSRSSSLSTRSRSRRATSQTKNLARHHSEESHHDEATTNAALDHSKSNGKKTSSREERRKVRRASRQRRAESGAKSERKTKDTFVEVDSAPTTRHLKAERSSEERREKVAKRGRVERDVIMSNDRMRKYVETKEHIRPARPILQSPRAMAAGPTTTTISTTRTSSLSIDVRKKQIDRMLACRAGLVQRGGEATTAIASIPDGTQRSLESSAYAYRQRRDENRRLLLTNSPEWKDPLHRRSRLSEEASKRGRLTTKQGDETAGTSGTKTGRSLEGQLEIPSRSRILGTKQGESNLEERRKKVLVVRKEAAYCDETPKIQNKNTVRRLVAVDRERRRAETMRRVDTTREPSNCLMKPSSSRPRNEEHAENNQPKKLERAKARSRSTISRRS